jgi:hypothetical protein
MSLSSTQNQILTGLMLGDGCLFVGTNTASLSVDRSAADIEYLKHNFECFEEYCKSGIKVYNRTQKINGNVKQYSFAKFSTRRIEEFYDIYHKWYKNRTKIIPSDLELTPLIIAIWFCDDGNIKLRGKNKDKIYLRFCTDGFTVEENNRLAKLLSNRYNEYFLVQNIGVNIKGQIKSRIVAHDYVARKLCKDIDKYMPQSMIRKAKWREPQIKLFDPYQGVLPNFKHRKSLSNKEQLLLDILNKIGPQPIAIIIPILLKEMENMKLSKFSEEYAGKFIIRLFKRNIIKRKSINFISNNKYLYYI